MLEIKEHNVKAFFELVKAGLWEKEVQLASFGGIDFQEVCRLANEQAVIGLVAAGLEHIVDMKPPKEVTLQFIAQTLQLEQRNNAMNHFIGMIVDKMRHKDIYTLLVKGQGVAQCYERPLWRVSGDIDFYLGKEDYEKAKSFLLPIAKNVEPEDRRRLHLGMTIAPWIVELHGTMYSDISRKMKAMSDEVHDDIFYNGNVRSWDNDGVTVFLPSANNDIIIVFNHFVSHFYGEGIGLRQVCDWCRLLWTYRNEIDIVLLEKRLKKMRLMAEWKAFAVFAVEYLGMPAETMPFYENNKKNRKRARKISKLIIETGNFGVNKDSSYRNEGPKWKEYFQTFYIRAKEFGRISSIFPLNALRFFITYIQNRFIAII